MPSRLRSAAVGSKVGSKNRSPGQLPPLLLVGWGISSHWQGRSLKGLRAASLHALAARNLRTGAQARGSSHTIARCQDVIMHSSHMGWSSPTGCHSVIMRRAQRSAAGHLLHTTQSSSGIGMAGACSSKVANLWPPSAPLKPYLRKVNGAHHQTRNAEPKPRVTRSLLGSSPLPCPAGQTADAE